MTPAGYAPTPLTRKLGIKPGHRVATLGAPDHFTALIPDLPESARLDASLQPGVFYDVIILFAPRLANLAGPFAEAVERLQVDGGLWVGWPKKSSPMASDISETEVRSHGLDAGLVDNKICAIDADWSGLRFVVRREHRAALRARRPS